MPAIFDFINDPKLLTFFNKSFYKALRAFIFPGLCFVVGCHYFPANFFQIPGLTPSDDKFTPGSFGAIPSKGFEPCGDIALDRLSFKG